MRTIFKLNITLVSADLLENMDQSTTENERMMRKRLYWSHYVWTLVLALALNRKPSVPKLKVELPGNPVPLNQLPALKADTVATIQRAATRQSYGFLHFLFDMWKGLHR